EARVGLDQTKGLVVLELRGIAVGLSIGQFAQAPEAVLQLEYRVLARTLDPETGQVEESIPIHFLHGAAGQNDLLGGRPGPIGNADGAFARDIYANQLAVPVVSVGQRDAVRTGVGLDLVVGIVGIGTARYYAINRDVFAQQP